MPAPLSSPVPINIKLFGSGVAAGVASMVKLVLPLTVLVRLKLPNVGVNRN